MSRSLLCDCRRLIWMSRRLMAEPASASASVKCLSTQRIPTKDKLLETYDKFKNTCHSIDFNQHAVNPKGVFCNNEIDLKEIQVYGFDFDYTLAHYDVSLYRLIFDLVRDALVVTHKYPNQLKNFDYLGHFPIRGLHLDIKKGWLMKIDSYHNVQFDTVYYGMNLVDKQDLIATYGGHRLNIEHITYSHANPTFHHFADLFCLPEISLLALVFQYFIDRGIHFKPEYIFQDIRDAINSIHNSQILHKQIVQSIDDYLMSITNDSSAMVKDFLNRLQKNGKNVFLITNSPFWFVNFGMQSLVGKDWINLFDLIICNSRKPSFFSSKSKPFRKFNMRTNSKAWETVTSLKKGEVYYEGNLHEMLMYTGWKSNQILYFGDHIYGDLAEPFLKYGLRTGAIINEVEREINVVNELKYQRNLQWLLALEYLIEKSAFVDDAPDDHSTINMLELRNQWLDERTQARKVSKESFNPYFGSVFRANNNASFFSRRMSRFADIYTSNITNLLNYPIDCHFIPKRIDLAHESTAKHVFNYGI